MKNRNISFISFCPIINLSEVIEATLIGYVKKWLKNEKERKILRKKPINSDKVIDSFRKRLSDRLLKILNNETKTSFFLPIHHSISGNCLMTANIDRISAIPIEFESNLLEYRIIGLNNPWRELLGYKLGYLFNRVATKDVTEETISQVINTNYQILINNAVARLIEDNNKLDEKDLVK